MGPMIRDQEWFPYPVAAAIAVAVAVGFWFFGMWLGGARAGRTDSCSCGRQSVLRRDAAPAVGSAQPTTRSHWCHLIHMAHAVTKLRQFALNAASMHSIKRSSLKGLGK